jgi:hypothetical protein
VPAIEASSPAVWAAFADAFGGAGRFDTIVGSEILYATEYYAALCTLLLWCLRPTAACSAETPGDSGTSDGGVALISTKRFYFGAGLMGSAHAFRQFATAFQWPFATASDSYLRNAQLTVSVVHSVEDGKSMTRDVLALRVVQRN